MGKTGLIPNKSYENFILGDDITNYLHLPHHVEFYDHSKMSIFIYGLKMVKLKQLNVIKNVIGKAKI